MSIIDSTEEIVFVLPGLCFLSLTLGHPVVENGDTGCLRLLDVRANFFLEKPFLREIRHGSHVRKTLHANDFKCLDESLDVGAFVSDSVDD